MRVALRVERLEARDVPASFLSLPVLPIDNPAVLDHARAIFARGQLLGRNPDVFVKFGDSNSSTGGLLPPSYLTPLGLATFNPTTSLLASSHPELLDTLSVYHNSFLYEGPGAYPGWRLSNVLSAVNGQMAATNAGIALIMIGTNDMHDGLDVSIYASELRSLVRTLLSSGVVPVLSTIPETHFAGGIYQGRDHQFNQVIADVATEFRVPLWNVWVAMNALPNQGILPDGVHLNTSPNGGGSFWPADMGFGQNVRNLQALQILDWFRQQVASGPAFIPPHPDWQEMPDGDPLYSIGRDIGFSPTVDVYDAGSGELVNRFLVFGPRFGGGVRVATGDVNGDGFADIVCATASRDGVVRVISGADGSELAVMSPFGKRFSGGLTVAVGDLDGDGKDEIVVGRKGNGSGVRVYAGGTFALASSFTAFPRMNAQGISVAIADIEGEGPVIVAGATGTAPVVRLFDADGTSLTTFRVFGGSGAGVTVTAADLDDDGFDELAVARSHGANRVQIIDPASQDVLATFAVAPVIDPTFGLRLGVLRADDGDSLLVANAPGSRVVVRAYHDLTGEATFLPPERDARTFGIFVG